MAELTGADGAGGVQRGREAYSDCISMRLSLLIRCRSAARRRVLSLFTRTGSARDTREIPPRLARFPESYCARQPLSHCLFNSSEPYSETSIAGSTTRALAEAPHSTLSASRSPCGRNTWQKRAHSANPDGMGRQRACSPCRRCCSRCREKQVWRA